MIERGLCKALLGGLLASLSLTLGTPFSPLPLCTDLVLSFNDFLHQLSLRQILLVRNKKYC